MTTYSAQWARVLPILLVLPLAALNTLLASSPKPAIEPPQAIMTQTIRETPDIIAIAFHEKKMAVEYTTPTISTISLELRLRSPMSNIDADLVAQEGAENILVGEKVLQDRGTTKTWTWPIIANHSGRVQRLNESVSIQVRYDKTGEGSGFKTVEVLLPLEINMLDFSLWWYLFMIWMGVVATYLFTDGGSIWAKVKSNLGEIKRPLGWLVISFIVTPAVYMQIKQLLPADQVLVSLLLALPMGGGLDFLVGKAGSARA